MKITFLIIIYYTQSSLLQLFYQIILEQNIQTKANKLNCDWNINLYKYGSWNVAKIEIFIVCFIFVIWSFILIIYFIFMLYVLLCIYYISYVYYMFFNFVIYIYIYIFFILFDFEFVWKRFYFHYMCKNCYNVKFLL